MPFILTSFLGSASATLQQREETSALGEALQAIPTDASAILIYVIVVGSIWLVWWAHRHSGSTPAPREDAPAEEPSRGRAPVGEDPADGAPPDGEPRPRPRKGNRAA